MKDRSIFKFLIVIWGVNISLLIFISFSMLGILGKNLNLYPQLFFIMLLLYNSLILFDCCIANRLNYLFNYIIKRSVIYLPLSFTLVWFSSYLFILMDSLIGLFSVVSLIISGKKLFQNQTNDVYK